MRRPFVMPKRLIVCEDNPPIPQYIEEPFLTPDECKSIMDVMANHPRLRWGLLGTGENGSYIANPDYRTVRVADLLEEDFPWYYEKLKLFVRKVNAQFDFDIYGILDDTIFMRYDEPTGNWPAGHFGWHSDNGANITGLRKLSMSIGLNDPSEYEGGELHLFDAGTANMGQLKQGNAVVFPSYKPHRVMDVTKGTRCVLIVFVLGPRFR
jgi:hypothetical protein